ncbi:MAG: HAMP domain-containing histidine kinase [Actinobacteria bacterium]|nr:HAMP domain-containing histidine kinase [Actinomycetota bacterium]
MSDQLERERAAREAEERARQAEQQLEQRAGFLAQAEHALKTPITVIKGFADLLEMSWDRLDDDAKRRDVEHIGRAATQLTERIHELLDEARSAVLARDMSPEPIDLLAFVQEICDELSALSGRHHVEVTGEARTALVDPRALRLILEHLVENAVKYSPGGGTVEVQIDGSSEGPLIRVRDRGIGIPPDIDLFAAFTRGPTDTEGVGLGLHIVSNLLRALGGQISAERNADRGSTFVVRFGGATGTGRDPVPGHSSPK